MRSLALKLSLAFLVVSLTSIIIIGLFAGRLTTREVGNFIDAQNEAALVTRLADYYYTRGSWNGVRAVLAPPPGAPLPNFVLANNDGRVIVPGLGHRPGQQLLPAERARAIPIEVDEQQVGLLVLASRASVPGRPPQDYLGRIQRNLFLAAIGTTAVALLLGVLLAQTLTRPLREITAATRAVAEGNLTQQIPVRSQDELGKLAASFNQMNAQLARARDLRRQMTADIAHDLRTPLGIILGHSEALSEGVLPANDETFQIIHDEAQRLNRLIDDLHTLSLAEAGELPMTPHPAAPQSLLERAAAAHMPRAQQQQVSLTLDIPPDLPDLHVDSDRIAQVLDNLISNALRHVPAGGEIALSARHVPAGVQMAVRDNGPGIDREALPLIFERFYRADKSRGRQAGGSGLGLAIARSIVEAHGGRIWAESEPGQGATFFIQLPLNSG